MTQLPLSSRSSVCVSVDLTGRNAPGGLPLLRGRELAESRPESLSQPLARRLAVCEVLVGYPGVLIFTGALSQPPHHPVLPIQASSV